MRASLLIPLLCAVLPVLTFADPDVPTLMGQAQRAYVAHDYDKAKDLFSQVLEIDPQNTLAIQYLRSINQALAAAPPPPKQTADQLILPKIDFKDATFSSALDFFKQQAAAQSVTVSFVSQLSSDQMQRKVTLSLAQIPFLDALKYLCQLDNATYKVERYAIVILPATADSSAPQ